MTKQTQEPTLTSAEFEKYRSELFRVEKKIRKNIFSVRKQRNFFVETGKFAISTALIFLLVFTAMNLAAFTKKASFLLANFSKSEEMNDVADEDSAKILENTQALKADIIKIKSPKINEKIEDQEKLPSFLPEISPPDNRLIIPRLGIHAPIKTVENIDLKLKDWNKIEGKIQDTLRDGVVNFPGTARPGEKGNAFITGHSSYYPIFPGRYKDVFALLPEIEIGEEIEVWQNQQKFIYRVSDKREISPDNTDVLNTTDDSRLTLMTCTPLGTALRRLIVTAQLVKSQDAE